METATKVVRLIVSIAMVAAALTVLARLLVRGAAGPNEGLHSSSCQADYEAYSKLDTGMSYRQVVDVIGCPGRELGRSTLGGTTTVMTGWDGAGSIGANMSVTFQDGRLVDKAQGGLR